MNAALSSIALPGLFPLKRSSAALAASPSPAVPGRRANAWTFFLRSPFIERPQDCGAPMRESAICQCREIACRQTVSNEILFTSNRKALSIGISWGSKKYRVSINGLEKAAPEGSNPFNLLRCGRPLQVDFRPFDPMFRGN
jgi:hypothetical protein